MLSQSGARPAVIKGMCVRDSQMQKPSLSLYFYLISSFQLHVMVVILSQGIRVSPDVLKKIEVRFPKSLGVLKS
jgi:hypothetical protein